MKKFGARADARNTHTAHEKLRGRGGSSCRLDCLQKLKFFFRYCNTGGIPPMAEGGRPIAIPSSRSFIFQHFIDDHTRDSTREQQKKMTARTDFICQGGRPATYCLFSLPLKGRDCGTPAEVTASRRDAAVPACVFLSVSTGRA